MLLKKRKVYNQKAFAGCRAFFTEHKVFMDQTSFKKAFVNYLIFKKNLELQKVSLIYLLTYVSLKFEKAQKEAYEIESQWENW